MKMHVAMQLSRHQQQTQPPSFGALMLDTDLLYKLLIHLYTCNLSIFIYIVNLSHQQKIVQSQINEAKLTVGNGPLRLLV